MLPAESTERRNQFEILDYRDHYQKYLIRSLSADEVIFSELYYRGWHAYVDGKEEPLRVAGLEGLVPIFRSIKIPEGSHIVEMKYSWLR